MNSRRLRALPLALTGLLAACATTTPQPSSHTPRVAPPQSAPVVNDIAHPTSTAATAEPAATGDVWDTLRNSFAMDDCDADPAIMSAANAFTRSPQRFENQLSDVLPHLAYVQQIAANHQVAGEFVLLPWIESHYQPVPGHKNNPAGMWQIMPVTAQALGMRVDKRYDGRLDVPQATDKVMALLRRYYDDLGDWRMVDYAYNAGEFSVRNMTNKYGKPPADPAIPHMPVKRVTREHLIKLLAMACVVREPERFHVTLPQLPSEQRLVKVEVGHAMPVTQAASHAGMSVSDFKFLNSGFRNDTVDPNAASYLLLPSGKAEQFRQSSLQGGSNVVAANDASLASIGDAGSSTGAGDEPSNSEPANPGKRSKAATYKIKSGDTLSTIARRYSVTTKQLQRWNRLQGAKLKPGQTIKVSGS
jgi:membrane-bound lytic murein transglycosylase D